MVSSHEMEGKGDGPWLPRQLGLRFKSRRYPAFRQATNLHVTHLFDASIRQHAASNIIPPQQQHWFSLSLSAILQTTFAFRPMVWFITSTTPYPWNDDRVQNTVAGWKGDSENAFGGRVVVDRSHHAAKPTTSFYVEFRIQESGPWRGTSTPIRQLTWGYLTYESSILAHAGCTHRVRVFTPLDRSHSSSTRCKC